ncbi:MAG: hypothetical protein WBQ60_08575 [Asticcacaulis sp.]
MLQSFTAILGTVAVLLICLLALIIGGKRERIGAALYLGVYIFISTLNLTGFEALKIINTGGDLLCLIGFIILCWKSPHPWPLWAAGFQLASLAADLSALMHATIYPWAYLTVLIASAYGVLLALLIGTFAAVAHRKSSQRVTRDTSNE